MKEIFHLFIKLGTFGFGGPIATMAMMEAEAVKTRRWLTPEKYAQAYALIKLMPGPTATQMAIYLGRLRGHLWGGIIAGTAFVFPSFVLVLIISYFYQRFHSFPSAEALFQGMQVTALAVILDSVSRMAKPYLDRRSVFIAVVSAALIFIAPRYEPLVILIFGLMGAFGPQVISKAGLFFVMPALNLTGGQPLSNVEQVFLVCVKAGALVFGTGLAIVPLLEADVVNKYHWLTHSEFLDGLAIGQITPGPVVITATFIGYKVAGIFGAVASTFGIFLPCFLNILFILPHLEKRLSHSPKMKGFAMWAIPSVIGGILGTTIRLGVMTMNSYLLGGIFVVACVWLYKKRPPVWAVIPMLGILHYLIKTSI